MEISHQDIIETRFVGKLIKKVKHIKLSEASNISDRILKNQPFIMSLLLGYKFDVEEDQLNDVMKMLFVIYLFFEEKSTIGKRQISESDFEKTTSINFRFLKYFSGEQTKESESEAFKQYLSNLRFKSLFTGMLLMSNTQDSFKRMNLDTKGMIVLGMKTLIDCLESNLLD